MKLQSTEINRSVSEDSWKTHWEVDKTTGGQWWDAIRFHARMWNYKDYFFLETVTGEIFIKKESFNWVTRDVVWWPLRKLSVVEWLVKILQSMYRNAWSCIKVKWTFSDNFVVQVELHQDSLLSPSLFVIMMETENFFYEVLH